MKKLVSVMLIAVVGVFFFVSSLFAGGPVDSVRGAQAMGGIEFGSFVGNFNFDRGESHGGWVSFNFRAKKVGLVIYIIYLAKGEDGTVLVGENDPPLSGLPSNMVGETRNYYLYLATEKGDAYGEFRKDLLLPGEPVEIILKPNPVQRIIPFAGKGSTLPENTVLKTDDGNTFSYASYAGGFPVWVDPLKATAYTIVDVATGLTIASGTIDPTKGATVDTNSAINIKMIGGVVAVPDGDYAYLDSQKFDGQSADGIPVKVYIWNLGGKTGNINAYSSTGLGQQITILRWVPESAGGMPEVVSGDSGYVYIGDGYDKVVVVITGIEISTPFSVNFSTGNGGGKG